MRRPCGAMIDVSMMTASARILCLALLLSSSACARPLPSGRADAGRPDPFLAGAARRAVTPDLGSAHPVFVAGFSRGTRAEAIHDDLWARALVLTDGAGRSVGLVTLDLIGFFHDDVEALRSELAGRHPDVALDYLAVSSTHNHAGPDVIGLWTPMGGSVDTDYVARIRREAADAVAEAWRNRRPAEIYLGESPAPDLAHDSRLPEVIDETLLVMGVAEAGNGRGIAALVNWNSHPGVVGDDNTTISADFPGGTARRVEREWGGVCLYASGALGGQIGSSRIKVREPETGLKPDSRLRRAELLGDAVGAIAMAALDRAREKGPEAPPIIRIRKRTLHLPMDNARFALGLSMGLIRPRRLYPPGGEGPGRLPSDLPREEGLLPGAFSVRTEVALVDVGSLRWAMIPGELYPELSLGAIQDPQDPGADFQGAPREPALRALSDKPLFLIGLANDEVGYIIPKSQWDTAAPYAYGLDEPQYGEANSLGPETAPLLMDALRELFSEDPPASVLQKAAPE